MKKNCEWCSVEFEIAQGRWATGKHAHRFCGRKCRNVWGRVHETDGILKQCKWCGVLFKPKRVSNQRAEYCSRECGFSSSNGKANPIKELVRMLRRFHACPICGKKTVKATCSVQCRYLLRNLRAREYQARQEEKRKVERRRRSDLPIDCIQCGTPFVRGIEMCRRLCSDCIRENRRRYRDARRARQKGAFIAKVVRKDIILRDAGRCQLCGKKVRLGRDVPHPLAAVLDHIKPLALGGTHEPKNVQLAHFICNSKKQGLYVGQLRLA